MLRTIELEEIVRVHHKICVEYDNEEVLNNILNDYSAYTLDEYIAKLDDYGIKVKDICENYTEGTDSVEYYDDYVED